MKERMHDGHWWRETWIARHHRAVVGAALTAFSIGLTMLPERFDRPSLFRFRLLGTRHGVSALDVVVVAILGLGVALLASAIWNRRAGLAALVRQSPLAVFAGVFLAGLGLGIFVTGTYSPLPPGSTLLGGILFTTVLLAVSAMAEEYVW